MEEQQVDEPTIEDTAPQSDEESSDDDLQETEDQASEAETEAETFPRSYVEELRQENGKYRQRAQRADDLARRLHTELVRATGKLADPEDLPFDDSHLDDPDALAAAVDDLLARKPHLASAGRPVKSGREPHLWPRVALTLPHFCANEPDRREHE